MGEPGGPDRFLTFVDAIVAIAITLLILPLVELTDEATEKPFGELMSSDAAQAKIASFLLSFVVISRLWRIHHRLMRGVEKHDRFIVTVSMLWALTIVSLPFPTALIAVYGSDRGAMGLYMGTLVVSSGCLAALSVYLERRGLTTHSPVPAVVSTALLALAAGLAQLVPSANYGFLTLLLLTGAATALWRRLRAR